MKGLLAWLSLCVLAAKGLNAQQTYPQYPLHSDGLNKAVQWDYYSPMINGQRIFIWSGEFHYWRIPVPGLWLDLMHKIKAAGFNSVAIYANWYWHMPRPDVLNFDKGAHDIETLFQSAKQAGLYVIFRPGPYINAETNAGGFPGWVTNGAYGSLRNNDTRYTDAWTPYFAKIAQVSSKYSISKGGPLILWQLENEYGQQWLDPVAKTPDWNSISYMEVLEKVSRDNGIDVPTFTNAPGEGGRSWSLDYSGPGYGSQDINGLDSYPQCWSCDERECSRWGQASTFSTVNYVPYFEMMSPTQPWFLPEFQGGSYLPLGGPRGGCRNASDSDFVNVFYRDTAAQRVTMMSLYMIYGGTNWGGFAWNGVGTSYDYSAPIQEDRQIAGKYGETKLYGLQIRAARDLTKTHRIGNGTQFSTNTYIFTTELQNADSKSRFYVVRHAPSNRTATDSYKLKIETLEGNFTIPQSYSAMQLIGHESKIFSVDYPLGGGQKVIYSTAEILAYSTVAKQSPLLVLWVPSGGTAEILLSGVHGYGKAYGGNVKQKTVKNGHNNNILLTFTQAKSSSKVVEFSGLRILTVDREAAYRTWAPSTSKDPQAPADSIVITTGPNLVRTVSLTKGTVVLGGDANSTTKIETFGPSSARSISWNGKLLHTERTTYGSLVATVNVKANGFSLPSLNKWHSVDTLPEVAPSYDDSRWIAANHMTTTNIYQPETLPVLWTEDYGIYWGPVLWRGRFKTPSSKSVAPTGVYLHLIGGTAFGFSAYLNGGLIGSYRGAPSLPDDGGSPTSFWNGTLSFSNATLAKGTEENVLFIIQDLTGKELRWGATIPRGISNAALVASPGLNFTSWKIAGTAGAPNTILDSIRGPLNEGGYHFERLGWHLPGFHVPSSWSPSTGSMLKVVGYGARFFLTTIPLHIPSNLDVSLSLLVTDPGTTKDFRLQLYVNGYQFGRYYSRIGNQIEFPVPRGIWDYNGENTVGVSIWAQDKGGAEASVSIKLEGAFDSSFRMSNEKELRPSWSGGREKYY